MNKKSIIFLLSFISFILVVAGCSNKETTGDSAKNVEKNKNTYITYVQKLKKVEESSLDIPFDINVIYDKLDNEEIRYQVVIDNPTRDIKNVKAVAVHNKQTDDVFPSIGIFDETVDLTLESESKGIILVGYIPFDGDLDKFECEMKVIISYELEEKEYTSYYVTKK